MKDADDPIPVPTPKDTILISDAFEQVFRALTPDWQILEQERLKDQAASRNYDKAQRRANEWLREKIGEGALRALIRDPGDPHSNPPRPPQTFQLNRRRLTSMSDFETGIDDDHFAPGDLLQHGPNTVIGGERRTVFFDRKEFDDVVKEITPPDGDRTAHPGELAASKPKSTQQEIRDVHARLWPNGYSGRAQQRNDAIRQDFIDRHLHPPAKRSIERALGGK
jgi:hypothetical protein